MKTPLMAALVAALSLASHSANAQEYAGQRYVGISIGKIKQDFCGDYPYVGNRLDGFDSVVTRTCPDKDIGIKLYAGHNLHKNFAVEAGFIDFGKFKSNNKVSTLATEDIGIEYPDAEARIDFNAGDVVSSLSSSAKVSANSLFIAGIFKVHVHPKATLFGKVGLHRWDIALETELRTAFVGAPGLGGGGACTADEDGIDWFYGIGGEVAPFSNNKIKLRAEYEMFPTEAFGLVCLRRLDDAFDFESFSIGITYAF